MKRILATALALLAPALAMAKPFGVVIHDDGHALPQHWSLGRVVYLDCRDGVAAGTGCNESASPTVGSSLSSHENRVARIIADSARRASGGSFPRGAVLYSAVGSRERLLNWLAAPVEGGRLRAVARDIRVVESTYGESVLRTAAECDAYPGDARLQQLRSHGVQWINVAGNQQNNGFCRTELRVLACDRNARTVVGLWDSEEPNSSDSCNGFQSTTNPGPLWIGSNIAPRHYYVGGAVQEPSWLMPDAFSSGLVPGARGVGTSWAAPGVAGGHLALASFAPYRSLADAEAAVLAAAPTDYHVTSPSSGSQVLPIERVEPETFTAARAALCSNSGAVTEGWWWDSRNGGSGMHIFNRHGNVVLGWFTYAANGRPTWRTGIATYTASGPITGTLYRTVSGPSQTSAAQNVAVGSFTLDRCDPAAMTLTWSLNASGPAADTELGVQRGVESLQRFCFDLQAPLSNGSCPGLAWPNEASITGTYYQSELPGAGYSVETQGNRVGIVHYFFDGNGQPVWGTALVDTTGAGSYNVPLHVFTGAEVCPTCATDGQNRLVATGSFQLHYGRYFSRMGMWLPLGGAATIGIPTSGAWPYAAVNRYAPGDDTWIGL